MSIHIERTVSFVLGRIAMNDSTSKISRFSRNMPAYKSMFMSIPWILVLYKKRKKIAEAVSFLLLVIVGRRSATESRGQGICRRQTGCAVEMATAQSSTHLSSMSNLNVPKIRNPSFSF